MIGLASALSAIVLCWLAARAHAYGEQALSRFGQHMLRYAGARHQTDPEEIDLNGAEFHLSTGTTDASVDALLDEFQRKCTQKNGRLAEQWATLGEKHHEKPSAHSPLWDGVFRGGGHDSGVIACAETGDTTLAPATVIERVRAVLATGELSKLGELRYVYAARDGFRTMFVAVWSEGPLNYRAMFPRQGDAPGHDPIGVPRPDGVRRVLSSTPNHRARATLNVYEASDKPAKQLIEFYAEQLPAGGFQLLTTPRHFIAARDGSRLLTISIQDDRHGRGIATIATQPD
ncbi:MAG TPA: hypothetical protein VGI70_07950 [Polyangiales bacterium]